MSDPKLYRVNITVRFILEVYAKSENEARTEVYKTIMNNTPSDLAGIEEMIIYSAVETKESGSE